MKPALAMLVIALGAALAAPAARRLVIERRAAAVVADLRRFADAFQSYAHERGNWPASAAAPGEMPNGMQPGLAGTNWPATTPIGGGYRWARHTTQRGERFEAAILIAPAGREKVNDDKDQLQAIDRQIDDGNLAGGTFRAGYRNLPVFILEH